MNNFFDRLNDGIRNIETSVVNLLSAVAPWLAPIIPAYMTYQHATETLHFPVWVAVPAAVVVEILGFSAISTFMAFWYFNRRNKANAKKAPVGWVIFAFLFYLALIVTSNILLDATDGAAGAVIAVRALFTLQTIPAAVIVISRAGHRNMLAEISKEKAESTRKVSAERTEENGNFPVNWRQVRKQLSREQIEEIARMSGGDISYRFGIDDRTARNWRKYAQKEVSGSS